ncbi:unnamed protein product [Nezara viridula]|uniref:Pseudouridylate synthase RPUSD2 n=1 Tax=Nezara viridula TaxID=85310 RepID=A0A9P0GYS4_NEZVI|nr:unnamed protein product [Nezara viridula]
MIVHMDEDVVVVNKPASIPYLFVDFERAYDSILRDELYHDMLGLGVPPKLVRLIQVTMKELQCTVRIQGDMSDYFEMQKGLRQGDCLACLLFNIALECAIRRSQIQIGGTVFNHSVQLLGFADDIALVGRTRAAIKDAFLVLQGAPARMGLKVNEMKTKFMRADPKYAANVEIRGMTFEDVSELIYRGSQVNVNNDLNSDIQRRIMAANRAYFGLQGHLKSRVASRKTKLLLYKTMIRPVLTYGHETPVLAKPLRIIHLDDDLVVLDKPCSLPVHPCGRYRHNTVVFILAKEYQLKNLRTIHRLDRLTSGLLLFGRTPKKARQMEHQIRNRLVQKEYVCRVDGEFPSEVVECSEPIEVVSYKIGVCKVSSKGKECTTTFTKIGYNPVTKTSVVLCQPHSGRMHQIRVHLQYLGYPVVNDPLYNHEVFGPERGKGGNIGKTDEELIRDLIRIHNAENWLGIDGDSDLFKPLLNMDDEEKGGSREASPCESLPTREDKLSVTENSEKVISAVPAVAEGKVTVATQTGHDAPDLAFQPEKMTTDPHCYECKVRYRDPKPKDLVMYLHAWKYQGPGWFYQTELPDWARVDWVDPED